MTVTLNPAALEALFQRPTVVAFVERVATEKVADPTKQAVAGYFHSAPTLHVEDDVDVQMQGSRAIVGIRDTHAGDPKSKGQRLVRQGLFQKWLRDAVGS